MKAILRSINNFSCKLKQSNNLKYNISPKIRSNKFKNISGNSNVTIEDAIKKDLKDYRVYGNTKQQILPDGYTQVDYIESSGTQYIDTGVNADSNLQVIIDMAYKNYSLPNQNVGAIRSENGYFRYHLLCQDNNFRFYAKKTSKNIGTWDNDRHIFNFNLPNRKVYTDESEYDINFEDFDTQLNFWLFGRNSNLSNLIFCSQIKQWACKMYYNGNLVRDFIPCYRNSDNEVGLYDLVNNVFYTNQGTGVFTYGSIAPTPDAPIEMVSCGDMTGNLCFTDFNNWERGQYDTSGNKSIISSRIRLKDLLPVEPNTIYYFDTFDTTEIESNHSFIIRECDSNGNFINNIGLVHSQSTITTNPATHYLMVTIGTSNATTGETFDDYQMYFNQEKLKPFICLNSEVDKSYEPYGYKIPVNVRSDNLTPTNPDDWEQGTIQATTGLDMESTTRLRTKNYYEIENDMDYYVSLEKEGYVFVNIILYDSNKTYLGQYYNIDRSFVGVRNKKINIPSSLLPNVKYYRFTIRKEPDGNILPSEISTIKPMITLGDSKIPFVPYYNETTNIYLDEPLRKIDEYSDYIDFINGKVVRKIKEIVLDGSETWNIVATYTNTSRFQNTTALKQGLAISDKKIMSNLFAVSGQTDNSDYEHIRNAIKDYPEYIFILINKNRLDDNTVVAFKTWLQSNNVTVDYVLSTPTEEDIELPNIKLIEGKNIISIGTEVQGVFEAEYYSKEIIDISNYKYNLRKVED